MSPAWNALFAEIGRWRDAGRVVEFWWRDDDARHPAPALSRLLALAEQAQVPLALAVIPEGADPGLFSALGEGIDILQHGTDHRNRAAAGEKKSEFSAHESPADALARLGKARAGLQALAGARFLPVLTPPWNRLPAPIAPQLAGGGFRGLSGYGPRACGEPYPGLVQVNTHVDIIAWKGGRGFVGDEAALLQAVGHLAARRAGPADPDEPTGWLTHHACHDEPAWSFIARLFDRLRGESGVCWRRARDLFPAKAPAC